MAPRKPAKPAAKKPSSPAKPAAKTAARKAATQPAPQPEPTGTCACCTPSGRSLCTCMGKLMRSCPVGQHICTRSFWASAVAAFLMIFATDWLVNNHLLMADYVATSAFWRTEGDIRSGLLVATQAVTALAYAAIILGMGHAVRWWGSMVSGIMASVPVAMVSVNTYAMMPFAETDIPAAWAATAVGQGALVGLAICAVLKASRAPETHTGDTPRECC